MVNNRSRVCHKRKTTDVKKETNCRRNIKEFLRLIDEFQCPTSDFKTLREEAKRKLNEIKKRKPMLNSLKENEITISTVFPLLDSSDSNTTESTPLRFNHSYGGRNCGNINHHKELPAEVRTYIEKIEGSKMVKFVIEKKLTATDVKPSQSRLLMPVNQLPGKEFLMQTGAVRLYVPERQQHYDLCLTEWDMRSNRNYSLRSGWNNVVKENELRESMVVQIWSFQAGDIPCLLLVPVDGGCCGGGTKDTGKIEAETKEGILRCY